MLQPAAELWSLVASVVSVVLGILAIALSLYFFVASKAAEKASANSLTKIETQAEMLQKLTGRQLDRLTKYVTEQQPIAVDQSLIQVELVSAISRTLASQLQQFSAADDKEKLISELISCYIALDFYSAQANYWAQGYLPEAALFDEGNLLHALARKMTDISAGDFGFMENLLGRFDPQRLEASPVAHLLRETRLYWRNQVRSSADVFVLREKAKQGP